MEITTNFLINGVFQVILVAVLVKIIVLPFLPPPIKNAFTSLGKTIREEIKEGTKKIISSENNEEVSFTDMFLIDVFMPFTALFIASSFIFSYSQQIYPTLPALAIFTGFISISLFVFSIPDTEEISSLFSKTDPLEQIEFIGRIMAALLILKLISLPLWLGVGLIFFKIPKVEENSLLDL